ncbi:unnamed protein product [Mytilus coruscus]|uniref:Uncharacterized protein n=1 Tax=Mytilus coruscus TaxID=42192 RepID=A0A6J8CYU3_MYTCO|nr:unnamed protein product [Mytilus coruscus]
MEGKQIEKVNIALEIRQREIHGFIKLPRVECFSVNRVVKVRSLGLNGWRRKEEFRTLKVTNRFVKELERTETYCEGPLLDEKDTCYKIMEGKQIEKVNIALEIRQREIHGFIKLPRVECFSVNRVVKVRSLGLNGWRRKEEFRTLKVTNRFVKELERTETYCEGPLLDEKDTCYVC